MRYKFLFFALSCFVLLFFTGTRVTATPNDDKMMDLRLKIAELTKQADDYKKSTLQKQKEADTLKRQIDILNNQVLRLQKEIDSTVTQITVTKLEIGDSEEKIYEATKKIEHDQGAISEAVSYLYQHDQTNTLAALMSNSSLSSFMNQAEEVSRVTGRMKVLLVELKNERTDLENQREQLLIKKTELETLNKNQSVQENSLKQSRVSKDKLLVTTKGQESKYQQLLTEVEKQKAEYFAELRNLESTAIANGTVLTHVSASSVPKRGTKIFKRPYDDYYLTQGFGMTSYARRGAYGGSPHSGIDVVSGFGSPIHSIGTGEVLASGFNNGFGNWVAIKHDGGMVSVYAHMQSPTPLRIGMFVTTDSVVGVEGSTGNSTGSHLHLSLYRDFFTYLNPKNGQLNFNYFDGTVNPLDYM